jgi:hypothetical protein
VPAQMRPSPGAECAAGGCKICVAAAECLQAAEGSSGLADGVLAPDLVQPVADDVRGEPTAQRRVD